MVEVTSTHNRRGVRQPRISCFYNTVLSKLRTAREVAMRRVILNTQTTHTLGRSCRVLKSNEDAARATDLRGLRLFIGHSRDKYAGHQRYGRPASMAAIPGAVRMLEPTGLGHVGPRRCWQVRRPVVSLAIAGTC